MRKLKTNITRNLLNSVGWKTDRKIIVIESDDWGTIRTSTRAAYNDFLKNNFPVDQCPYNSFDCLESNDDLELLFEVLSSVKDIHNNPAIITANNIVGNPDFEKIKASGFQQYYYEPFTETLLRYPKHDRVEKLYAEGIEKKFFQPQFHGREHVNTGRWLRALQDGNKAIQMAFNHSMFTVHSEKSPYWVNELMDALDADSAQELESKSEMISQGLQLFKSIWGFQSKSFIAPCYIWSSNLEPVLFEQGVKYIQGVAVQKMPRPVPGSVYKKKYHYPGQQNKLGQYYLVRNAFFEPSTNPQFDWVDDCLQRIEIAFKWKKPAVISAHRVNFMGYLRPENREANLMLLSQLLQTIRKRWPQSEFMSSDQLGDLINE